MVRSNIFQGVVQHFPLGSKIFQVENIYRTCDFPGCPDPFPSLDPRMEFMPVCVRACVLACMYASVCVRT